VNRTRLLTGASRAGKALALIGWLGFFANLAPQIGFVNTATEWPLGHADQVLVLPSGLRAATHFASGRIQLYDERWQFVRGWQVRASGGVFRVRLTPEGALEVLTARQRRRLIYSTEGALLSSGTYAPGPYPHTADGGADVPTPSWLWLLSNPIHAWGVMASGLLLGWAAQRARKAPAPTSGPRTQA
jgi:hypothetical protein